MKKIFLATALLAGLTTFAYARQPSQPKLSGTKFTVLQQIFASHDAHGTDTDTIKGKIGDYIQFDDNGLAYTFFDNKYDTLEYKIIGADTLSFGDTPFKIERSEDNVIVLYQQEMESNGDYNSVWYHIAYDDNHTFSKK